MFFERGSFLIFVELLAFITFSRCFLALATRAVSSATICLSYCCLVLFGSNFKAAGGIREGAFFFALHAVLDSPCFENNVFKDLYVLVIVVVGVIKTYLGPYSQT